MATYNFKVRGIQMPTPAENGIKVTDEPVWDPDAGRNLKGKMIATLVCWKRTVEVTWNNLTMADCKRILDAVGVGTSAYPFFDITYNDVSTVKRPMNSNGQNTIHVYVSSIPRNLITLKNLGDTETDSLRRIGDVTITFIEQ